MKIAILAGGLGQRLWPLSHSRNPKHVLPVIGKKTLLQQTFNRLRKKFAARDIFIVTEKSQLRMVRRQLPQLPKSHILVEPVRRGTAAAVGLAAYTLAKKTPLETLITMAADHYIPEESKFLQALIHMGRFVDKFPLSVCLLGIKPTYAETGYGYIKSSARKKRLDNFEYAPIIKFIEKPNAALAKKLIKQNGCFWNPSYFAWKIDRIQELFSKRVPQTHELLGRFVYGQKNAFAKIENQAVEYAVLEKIKTDFFVLPSDFPWADIGHWATIKEIQTKKPLQNITLGTTQTIDSTGSLVYNYTTQPLAAIGIKDLLIIQAPHGTLVCHKNHAQEVKKIVEKMSRARQLKKFL